MLNFWIKIFISAGLIASIHSLSNRYLWISAILASIPLVSVLSMLWMYAEHRNTLQISEFCTSTFWMVLPSMVLFITLPILLKKGYSFYVSLPISLFIMIICYFMMATLLKKIGIF